MPHNELRMAELLCTRLCHDLTGPIGAVNNGAEFLSEEGFNMQGQAVDLIVSSAFSAVSRLQFYRFAYGRVKDAGEASLADKKQMVEDFFVGSKVVIDWPDQHTDAADVSVSLKMARLLFNLLIIASNSLLKGGTISIRVTEEQNGAKCIGVAVSGEAVKWEAEIENILMGKADIEQISPKTVQIFLTGRLAEELKVSFDIHAAPDSLGIRAIQTEPSFSGHALGTELTSTTGEYHHG